MSVLLDDASHICGFDSNKHKRMALLNVDGTCADTNVGTYGHHDVSLARARTFRFHSQCR